MQIAAAFGAQAGTLRIATWHVELIRDGPGLLLRDILRGDDDQIAAVVSVLAETSPDIVLLTAIDWDYRGTALAALRNALQAAGQSYPYHIAERPNAGLMTPLDLDGDGRFGGPGDAQGWGRFPGNGGMALLSKVPIAGVRDLSDLLWADLPGAELPHVDGNLFPSEAAYLVQRVSSVAHWDISVGGLHLLAFSAGPPVFDGPEDRNGLRNSAEIALWQTHLDKLAAPLVVLGNANLDPIDGDGRHEAIGALLGHPRLQDPRPRSAGGVRASARQGGVNTSHKGDPGLDTADWVDVEGPGNLRVSYVLPSKDLEVLDSGVFWPLESAPGITTASRHRLVWVDLAVD